MITNATRPVLQLSAVLHRTEQNRTEQNRTEQNRTEQNRTEQNRTHYPLAYAMQRTRVLLHFLYVLEKDESLVATSPSMANVLP